MRHIFQFWQVRPSKTFLMDSIDLWSGSFDVGLVCSGWLILWPFQTSHIWGYFYKKMGQTFIKSLQQDRTHQKLSRDFWRIKKIKCLFGFPRLQLMWAVIILCQWQYGIYQPKIHKILKKLARNFRIYHSLVSRKTWLKGKWTWHAQKIRLLLALQEDNISTAQNCQ